MSEPASPVNARPVAPPPADAVPAAPAVPPVATAAPTPVAPTPLPKAVPAAAPPALNAPEETNVWPDETAEAAFIAETRGRGEPVLPARPPQEEELVDPKALPPLDQLVKRIPAEVHDVLEDLFRAKFTAVRRVRKSDLKS